MAQLTAVTREQHGQRRWHPFSQYHFALARAVLPLAAAELPKAALGLVIGFVPEGAHYAPVALTGIAQDDNLYVAKDGSWLSAYVPAALRAAPFALATSEHGERVLCIDDALGALSAGPGGEPFFDEQGMPSAALAKIIALLQALEANREPTERACAELARHQLIQPWPISVDTARGQRKIEGLYRIDEARLNQCDGAALQALRDTGALAVAYCQMISREHVAQLGLLADAHARYTGALPIGSGAADLDFSFLNQGDTLNFGV